MMNWEGDDAKNQRTERSCTRCGANVIMSADDERRSRIAFEHIYNRPFSESDAKLMCVPCWVAENEQAILDSMMRHVVN